MQPADCIQDVHTLAKLGGSPRTVHLRQDMPHQTLAIMCLPRLQARCNFRRQEHHLDVRQPNLGMRAAVVDEQQYVAPLQLHRAVQLVEATP